MRRRPCGHRPLLLLDPAPELRQGALQALEHRVVCEPCGRTDAYACVGVPGGALFTCTACSELSVPESTSVNACRIAGTKREACIAKNQLTTSATHCLWPPTSIEHLRVGRPQVLARCGVVTQLQTLDENLVPLAALLHLRYTCVDVGCIYMTTRSAKSATVHDCMCILQGRKLCVCTFV